MVLVANKGRERKNISCYVLCAQHKVKKDFLVQLYVIFSCIIGFDDSRRGESKIKAFVFPRASNASNSPSVGALCMGTHGLLCSPVLPEGQVKEACRVQLLGCTRSGGTFTQSCGEQDWGAADRRLGRRWSCSRRLRPER